MKNIAPLFMMSLLYLNSCPIQSPILILIKYSATTFASSYLENNGRGQFKIKALPTLAQTTLTRDIIIKDVNRDGNMDMILFGNYLGFEVETPRQDAGCGLLLLGDGKGNFKVLMSHEIGLYINGEVANVNPIQLATKQNALLVAKNNELMQLVALVNESELIE